MKALEEAISRSARGYRLGMEGEGATAMVQVVDGIIKGMASGKLRGEELLGQLGRVLQAQATGDYLYLADVLEYEIAPLIV